MSEAKTVNIDTFSLEQIELDIATGTQFEDFLFVVIGPMDQQNMSVFLKTACSAVQVSDGALWIDVEAMGRTHTFSAEKGSWNFKEISPSQSV